MWLVINEGKHIQQALRISISCPRVVVFAPFPKTSHSQVRIFLTRQPRQKSRTNCTERAYKVLLGPLSFCRLPSSSDFPEQGNYNLSATPIRPRPNFGLPRAGAVRESRTLWNVTRPSQSKLGTPVVRTMGTTIANKKPLVHSHCQSRSSRIGPTVSTGGIVESPLTQPGRK